MEKRYVKVNADFEIDGSIIPKSVEIDGNQFAVQRVFESVRAASLKAGGTGVRYRCQIENRERYLYLEDYKKAGSIFGAKWFVET